MPCSASATPCPSCGRGCFLRGGGTPRLAREGFPLPSNSPPFPQRALFEGVLPSRKKRSYECPAVPATRATAIPQRRSSCRSPSFFHFSHRPDSPSPFLPGDRQRSTAIMPRRPPSTRITCVWRGVGARGRGGPFRMGKRASPPPQNTARASTVPACPLDKSRERMVKNSFPHPVPARRLSRVPE